MKKITVLLLAATLCLCLAACSKESEIEQSPEKIQTEAIEELVGMWHLDGDRNDPTRYIEKQSVTYKIDTYRYKKRLYAAGIFL